MANYSQLKQSVKNVIKQNGQQEITGEVLQSVLISMITNLGMGDLYAGLAIPSTNPGTPDSNVFYIAVQQGTYANFGGLTVGANDGLTILAYNGTWTKTATGTAMKTDITTLQGTINSLSSTLQTVKSDLDTAERSITTLQWRTLPLSVSFDIDKIDALTDSSGSTDIKAAFTPLSGIGVAPVAGNILRSGNVIKNSQEVAVIWSDYDSKTAYYSFSYVIDNVLKIFQTDAKTFVRVAKTIVGGDVGAEIEDLQDRVSIGKAPIWITMTLEGESHDPTNDNIGDIIFFEDGNYLKEVVRGATGGQTLGQAVDMETGRLYVYGGNLCKWDGTKFVPFYQEEKEKRYLFSLDSIDSLTTATDSETIYQSFIPVGETVYKLPTTGDLLGDEENNIYADILYAHCTEAMDEGGITLSYYKDGVVKTIRITGDDYEWGTWKVAEVTTVKPKYKYNLQKIFALASYSESKDIEEAFTPTYAPDGNTAMRLPQSGDLLEYTNGATSVVLKGTSSAFSFFYDNNRRDITLSGSAGNYKVMVEVTPMGVRVFDLDKFNALTDESTPKDIEEAFRGNHPTAGDLLEGADESSWVIMSGSETSTLARTFTYHTVTKLRTLTVSGDQGNETIKVEETDLAETEYEPKKYDYDKVMALSNESTELDMNEAFTPIGGSEPSTPTTGDLLVSTDGRNNAIILARQQTTASNASINIRYIYGNILRNISVRLNPRFSISVSDIELDKEVETNGALRITTSNINNITTGGSGSYDLGVTFQQLQDAISNNSLIIGNINGELYAANGSGSSITLLSVAYLMNNWYSLVMTIPSYTGTTATVTVTTKLLAKFVQIPYSFLSGEIGGTYENVKMSDLLAANIIQTDKGIATLDTTSGYVLSLLVDGKDYVRCTIDYSDNGGLKLTARTVIPISGVVRLTTALAEGKSVDIGMTLEEFVEKNPSFVIDSVGMLFYCMFYDASNIILASLLSKGNDKNSIGFSNLIAITDAENGKVNISDSEYVAIVPKLGSDGKLPADVMPDSFIAGTGVTAIQTVTELPQSPDSGTLYLIMPSETTTSEEQL